MAIQFHPPRGSLVTVDFEKGFKVPEMVKKRLCVVISPQIDERVGLCTIVPLSTTVPNPIMPYHYEFQIPFQLPKGWGNESRWLKGDMIYAAGFHRVDLLYLGKDRTGKRIYQTTCLSNTHLENIQNCVLAGLGLLQKLT